VDQTPHLPCPVELLGFAPDLLDTNESTMAFVVVDGVGSAGKSQASGLESLASLCGCLNYCGRTADASLAGRYALHPHHRRPARRPGDLIGKALSDTRP
jgi:hypothetical protein